MLKLVSLYNRIKRSFKECPPLLYHPYADLVSKTVNREEFIVKFCTGKKVLHFGFLDAPLLEEKVLKNLLLHQKLSGKAEFLFGVDIDEISLQRYREITHDYNNIISDLQNGIDSEELIKDFDAVLLPEVLEHIPNPTLFLQNLCELCARNNNASLCITVPNAFSIEGFVAAMNGFEFVHPDHYYYFSPYTLNKLLSDSGFKNVELWMYAHQSMTSAPAITKNGIIAVCKASA